MALAVASLPVENQSGFPSFKSSNKLHSRLKDAFRTWPLDEVVEGRLLQCFVHDAPGVNPFHLCPP